MALLAFAAVGAGLLGFTAHFIRDQVEHARREAVEQAIALTRRLATDSATPLATRAAAPLEIGLGAIMGDPGVRAVRITDVRGAPIRTIPANAAADGRSPPAPPGDAERLVTVGPDLISVWEPVTAGTLLGWVNLDFSLERVAAYRRQLWTGHLLGGFVAAGLTSLLLMLFLRKPIQAIRNTTDFVNQLDTRRGQRIKPVNGPKEIEDLQKALNYVSLRLEIQESALLNAAERLTAVVDNGVTGIVIVDATGVVETFNPAAEGMFGYRAQEVIGRNVSMLISEPHRAAHHGYVEHYVRSGTPEVMGRVREVQARRKNGEVFPIQLLLSDMLLDGEMHFVGFIVELTERKAAEEKLRQSQKMEAVGRLTAGVAHEFNNLLTAIGGFARLVKRHADDPEVVNEWADDIIDASDQAASLTRELLHFSHREPPNLKAVSIGTVLEKLESLVRPTITEMISTRFDVADRDAVVRVDPERLSQALLNLVINAKDAMPEGGELTIASRIVELDANDVAGFDKARPGPHVAISVSDSGTGIDETIIKDIFEPFFTTKEVGRGTGLGLAMVYGMAQQSSGVITVESEVGVGTTFTVYLPHLERTETEAAAEAGDTAEEEGAPTGSETILVVEDEPAVRNLARIALESLGYTVLTAHDGAQAQELCGTDGGSIDLLLADLGMPRVGGHELAGRLAVARPELKVIFMTGYNEATYHADAGEPDGDTILLRKPFDPNELGRLVRSVLDASNPA
ncbi:MAG: PAS domain S-box protein [Kiloniellaceae bacterium]